MDVVFIIGWGALYVLIGIAVAIGIATYNTIGIDDEEFIIVILVWPFVLFILLLVFLTVYLIIKPIGWVMMPVVKRIRKITGV